MKTDTQRVKQFAKSHTAVMGRLLSSILDLGATPAHFLLTLYFL